MTRKNIFKKFWLVLCLHQLISCGQKENACFDKKCIYLSGHDATYMGVFIDQSSDSTLYSIQLKTGGGNFLFQKKMKYIVERMPSLKHPDKFISESTTGFIENNEGIWLHPPRVDKFKFITQLAPYPEVRFPITPGDSLSGSIHMMGNWGDWTGHSSEFYLHVVTDTSIATIDGLEKAYILKGCGSILEKTSCVTYIFSNTRGFIYAKYENSDLETFEMKRHLDKGEFSF